MSGVSDAISKVLDFFTTGYTEEPNDPFKQLEETMGAEYPVDKNAAMEPVYATEPITKNHKSSNVSVFPGARGTELMVIEPRSLSEDSASLIKYLQEGRAIVLNLQLLDRENAQRLIDIMSGATQALRGHQQKITDTAFIFAPTNISISADTLKNKASMSDGIWGQRQY